MPRLTATEELSVACEYSVGPFPDSSEFQVLARRRVVSLKLVLFWADRFAALRSKGIFRARMKPRCVRSAACITSRIQLFICGATDCSKRGRRMFSRTARRPMHHVSRSLSLRRRNGKPL
eukprot:1104415-Prymnesium_polylepis.2